MLRQAIGGMTTRAMLALIALCSGMVLHTTNAQPASGIRRIRMNIVSSRSLLGGANPADAQAAGNVWLHAIGRRRGFDLDGSFTVAPNLDAIRKQVEDSSVDAVLVDVLEYLQLSSSRLLEPFVALARGKSGCLQSELLLVNRDAGISSVADLRGRTIAAYSRTDAELGRVWMETLLNDHHLGPAENFFNSVSRATKPSSACLPVFFGKQDACILDSAGWEMMAEFNPQLVSRMLTLATSPAYLDGILCVHVHHTAYRDDFRQALVDLHKDPAGKQLLMVFRAEYAVPVTEAFTNSARDLWKHYASFAHPSGTAGVAHSRGAQ